MKDEQTKRVIIQIRMELAALRQFLKEMDDGMTDNERDKVVNRIIALTEILRKLEE